MKTIFKYIIVATLTLILLWLSGFVVFGARILLLSPKVPQHADAIVVFTGGPNRIDAGLNLFAQKIAPQLFITGVNPQVPRKDILTHNIEDLPECCISYDLRAKNTIENGLETRQWVAKQNPPITSIILVTSDYHMPRAAQEIRFALPGVKIYRYPVSMGKTWHTQYMFRILFLEYHKYLYRNIMTRFT